MAKEKYDVTALNDADLKSSITSMEQEYQQMKFDHAAKGLGNPMELRDLRRKIARSLTEARSRELAAMTPEQLEMRSKLRARRRKN